MPVTVYLVLIAAFVDYLIADPWSWPHPVQFMGWWISHSHKFCYASFSGVWPRRIAGIGLGLSTIAGSAVVSWGIVAIARHFHPIAEMVLTVILLASCLAARGLRNAAIAVLNPLEQGNLSQARTELSRYVGRDTAQLSEPGILRAVLETVAENTTDGVTGPLFFMFLGLWLGLNPVPLAMAYKAASTLDSMIGYRREPYIDLGWFSAQLEDRLTWLPCRLTVLTIALLSGRPLTVLRICRRDAPQDPSPNSGWSECAYAAALGVQLGGENVYQGQVRVKPLLGDGEREVAIATVYKALRLLRWTCLVWLFVGSMLPGLVLIEFQGY